MSVSSPLDVIAELRIYCHFGVVSNLLIYVEAATCIKGRVSSVSISRVGETGGVDMKHEQVVRWVIPVVDDNNPANMTP